MPTTPVSPQLPPVTEISALDLARPSLIGVPSQLERLHDDEEVTTAPWVGLHYLHEDAANIRLKLTVVANSPVDSHKTAL